MYSCTTPSKERWQYLEDLHRRDEFRDQEVEQWAGLRAARKAAREELSGAVAWSCLKSAGVDLTLFWKLQLVFAT